jgi:hypothetical protein
VSVGVVDDISQTQSVSVYVQSVQTRRRDVLRLKKHVDAPHQSGGLCPSKDSQRDQVSRGSKTAFFAAAHSAGRATTRIEVTPGASKDRAAHSHHIVIFQPGEYLGKADDFECVLERALGLDVRQVHAREIEVENLPKVLRYVTKGTCN